jgi:hypothetical protein
LGLKSSRESVQRLNGEGNYDVDTRVHIKRVPSEHRHHTKQGRIRKLIKIHNSRHKIWVVLCNLFHCLSGQK